MNLTLKHLMGLVAALVMGSIVSGTALAGNGKHQHRDREHHGYQYQAGSEHQGGRHYDRKHWYLQLWPHNFGSGDTLGEPFNYSCSGRSSSPNGSEGSHHSLHRLWTVCR